MSWYDLLERHAGAELAYEAVPFDHPLWVLYSSGTTGRFIAVDDVPRMLNGKKCEVPVKKILAGRHRTKPSAGTRCATPPR